MAQLFATKITHARFNRPFVVLQEHRLPSGKFHLYEHDIHVYVHTSICTEATSDDVTLLNGGPSTSRCPAFLPHSPFFMSGPGIVPGVLLPQTLVNNVDIGPSLLELAGVSPPSSPYTLDGRSFVAQLTAAGRAAQPWRSTLLFEYWGLGYTERGPCANGTTGCPNGVHALEDAPSNTWAGLRILNQTHNIKYAEFRGFSNSSIVPTSTNFTAGFDLQTDPWELVNEAGAGGKWSLQMLASLHAELWAVANCTGAACP